MVLDDVSHHTQLLKGLIDMCLLAVIDDHPSYGYEMVRKLEERKLEIASDTSIYPVLKRLGRRGLIDSYLVDSDSGPARKYYRITHSGRETLSEWVRDWRTVRNGVDDVLGGTHH